MNSSAIKNTYSKHLKRYLGRELTVEDIIMFMENFVEKLYTKSYGIWNDRIDFDKIYSTEFYKDIQNNFPYKGTAFRAVGYNKEAIENVIDFDDILSAENHGKIRGVINITERNKRIESMNRISWSKNINGVDWFISQIRRRDVEVIIQQKVTKGIDVMKICKNYLEFLEINKKHRTFDRYKTPLGQNQIINKAKDMIRVNEVLSLLSDNYKVIEIRRAS